MNRYGTIEEQAAPILFFASDEASYITGVTARWAAAISVSTVDVANPMAR